MANTKGTDPIPHRVLGRTGAEVCIMGLGGYHLGTIQSKREAVRIVQAAVDEGITFMDNAWEYHDGESETLMGKALSEGGRRDQVFLMTKCCTHGRGKAVAFRQLHQSLRRLRTDHFDLWQIHEVVYENDPEKHFAQEGAAEALAEAKRQGKVRFVGFTGHKDPRLHLKMLKHGFPFDTCDPAKKRAVKATDALRYAMSLPVATTITGIDSMKVLRQNLAVARGFQPLAEPEMEALRRQSADLAADGRFELYKTTAKHEGPVGRKEHGFPEELEA